MIAVIDYDCGNLRSVHKAFEYLGLPCEVTRDRARLHSASHLVLPGVGAVSAALDALRKYGLTHVIKEEIASGKPFLGICLGMQMLFDRSLENGEHDCFGVLPGVVAPFACDLPVPHIGWNEIEYDAAHPLFRGVTGRQYVYFVHSYRAECVRESDVLCMTGYGERFPSAAARGNVAGLQFHPEKSGDTGLAILRNFGEMR